MSTEKFLKTQMKLAPLIGRRDYGGAVQVLEGALTDTFEDLAATTKTRNC